MIPEDAGREKSPRELERQERTKKQCPIEADSGFIAFFFSFN